MKRAYIVYNKDFESTRAAIIHETAAKAKLQASNNFIEWVGGEWTDMRVKWIKDADVDGLEIGDHIQQDEAYRRGIFDCIIY
ncbi:MAG: hypothetical protein KAJ03_10755 [Gammaproteobacteria bacterium]|nr:hypothetical protein [Gammaproteobacteria bacterium]